LGPEEASRATSAAELAVGTLRPLPEQFERLVRGTGQGGHDDALGLSDEVTGFQRLAHQLHLVSVRLTPSLQLF
jgi:hypothetical protein